MIASLLARAAARIRARRPGLMRDRRGNVMIIFAFAVIPITFATGMGIDYGSAMQRQTRLNAIADATALAAVAKPMMQQTMTTACTTARGTFTSQMAGMTGLTLDPASQANLQITITDTYAAGVPVTVYCSATAKVVSPNTLPLKRTATVIYSGKSTNQFADMLGVATLPIGGTSTTKTTLAPYIDIHLALDTSQSMGLAASDADAKLLWDQTTKDNGEGCQFGCHVAAQGKPYANDVLATKAGARLRVDYLRSAVQDMISTAKSKQASQTLYRFAMYRVGTTSSSISRLTSNLDQSMADVNALTLGPNDSGGTGDTNLPDIMNYAMTKIHEDGAIGDGTTPSKPRTFLFLVTDGVTDVKGGCTYGHCTKPISAATCQAYKDAGVTVGVVYTTYIPTKADPTNPSSTALRPEYLNLIRKFSDPGYVSPNPSDNSADIGPALQACASPGWFFEATDGVTIHAAMVQLFSQAAKSSLITK